MPLSLRNWKVGSSDSQEPSQISVHASTLSEKFLIKINTNKTIIDMGNRAIVLCGYSNSIVIGHTSFGLRRLSKSPFALHFIAV